MSYKKRPDTQKTKDEQWDALIRVVELFRRYFSGEASQREQNSIETWDPMENEEELLNDKNLEKDCDTVTVWNAVSHELKFDRKLRFPIQRHFSLGKLQSRYAAAVVIFILLGGGIFFHTQHSITGHNTDIVTQTKTLFQTTNDQIRLVILPDGSHIQMNRGTKFSYATHAFNRKQREVWLEGEAFFEVAKNKEKPFIIHTGTMQTTVRGTSFNVKAYPQLAENVVSVRTGKVEVSNHDQMLAVLVKNKQLAYNRLTNKAETSDAAWEDAAGWREGELTLNYANRDELKLKLKQYYQVDIQFRDNALNGIKIKSTFLKSTSLSDVLSTIKALYGIQYSTNGNQVIIHN